MEANWKVYVALTWPSPQGLLGTVDSKGWLLSSRASSDEGVGFRNSFLGREGIREKARTSSSLKDENLSQMPHPTPWIF